MFLTTDDYLPQIKQNNLESMIQANPTILTSAQAMALDTLKSYLFDRYDTAKIFSAVGSERNMHLVQCGVNLVLHLIYQRLPNHRIAPHVETAYNETINFLERVADGKNGLDLPKRTDPKTGQSQQIFRWGSHQKRSLI
jgi:phage gp36-like protein